MEKVIRMECTKRGINIYRVQIIEQSYIREDFGNPTRSFISSKRFELRSAGYPAYSTCGKLFVRGSSISGNHYTLDMSAGYLRKVMHAVREYNSHLIIDSLPDIPSNETFIID